MKKLIIAMAILTCALPVLADDENVYSTESVRSFARPNDARFQYSLPDRSRFKHNSKQSSESTVKSDEDAIELDVADTRPAKKIIKKMSSDAEANTQTFDRSDMPMNYDSFPKYYDPNDMSTQQFMPTMSY